MPDARLPPSGLLGRQLECEELDRDAKAAPRHGLPDVPSLVRRRERDPWAGFDEARRSLVP